jgi:hypothetical protein
VVVLKNTGFWSSQVSHVVVKSFAGLVAGLAGLANHLQVITT